MLYPKMAEIPTSRDILDKFKGYNHNLRIGDGEFYDMKNLTGDYYPVLSPRKKRGIYLTPNKPNGMCSNTRFCYVDGSNLILRYDSGNEEIYDLALTGEAKDLISIGANIVIMPDQKYINTVSPADRGDLLSGVYNVPTAIGGSNVKPKLVCTFVDENGKTLIDKSKNIGIWARDSWTTNYPKAEKLQGWYMWSMHNDDHEFRLYHSEQSTSGEWRWIGGSTQEYRIAVFGVDDDADYFESRLHQALSEVPLTINGINSQVAKVSWGDNDFGRSISYSNTIEDLTSGESVIRSGIIFRYHQLYGGWKDYDADAPSQWFSSASEGEAQPIVIDEPIQIKTSKANESTIPDIDYVIESSNRLWGCRYGANNNGDFVNEIYASKLGDFKDWVTVNNISTDSYTVPVGTSGAFTGAINYGGKPIFFKEDCMHRVFGDFPANYQVQTIMCKGVQEGCSKSLAIVNDVLYYKSRSGICAFDGSLPVEISMQFGDKQYKNAVAGAIGDKYYVSMQDESGEWHMFAYDTIKRLWHREDGTHATQFCNHKGELYYIDYADRYIHSIKGKGVEETTPVPWMAETGILGANTPDNKYVSRLDLRMSIARGSELAVYIEYDSMGDWEKIADIEGLTLNTFTIPVQPRRCDHFRLKFVGEGEAKIFSISKVLEESE